MAGTREVTVSQGECHVEPQSISITLDPVQPSRGYFARWCGPTGPTMRAVCIPVSRAAVVARLEGLLPGLSDYSEARVSAARAKRNAVWNRVHPNKPSPFATASGGTACLDVDYIVEHATALGARVSKRQLQSSSWDGALEELTALLLGDMDSTDEAVFVVSDKQECCRTPAEELRQFVEKDTSFPGDEVFVWPVTARIVIVHHEGWLFDVRV